MRHYVLLVATSLVAGGCASPHGGELMFAECGLKSEWVAMASRPENASFLINLATQRGAYLEKSQRSHDHWFRSDSGNVRLCRVSRFTRFRSRPLYGCGTYQLVEFASEQSGWRVVDSIDIVCST